VFPEWILGGFIHESSTLALAKNPLRVAAGFLFIDSVGMVLMNALMGAGDTRRVMFIGIGFQWLIFLPIIYVIGPVMGLGLVAIFATQAAYRGLQALTFASMWKRGRWQSIELH
jgi:MATE family multidrug resistance protein